MSTSFGTALEAALGTAVTAAREVAGGSINDAYAVDLKEGERAFVKTRAGAEPGEYSDEAAGLRWLAEGGEVRAPAVLAVGEAEPRFLALEWIEQGSLSDEGAEELGRGLAGMHALGAPAHLWLPGPRGPGSQRLGSVAVEAEPADEWAAAYAEQRLLPLAEMARDGGTLSESGARAVEAVCERIAELAGPPEPPARLHGDLWSGNVHPDPGGRAWLIDPAAQGGHREMDLAMLRLFGAPPERLFDAYAERAPLAEGWRQRLELWQLQPLLVHAVLFGGHYGAAAERAARAYL